MAANQKRVGVAGIIPRGDYEKSPGVFDAMGHDPPQDAVLFDALLGGLGVFDSVARPAVEQSVVASAGAVSEIAFFDQHAVEAAHGQVAQQAGSCGSAADDENFGLNFFHRIS